MKNITVWKCSLVRESSLRADNPIDTPDKIAALVREFIGPTDREHFVAVFLDARNKVAGINLVSMGTMSSSLVHPRETFKPAILANAAGIIVAHNHPSGDCTPSPEDKECTGRLSRAGQLLGIPLIDHVIITASDFYSFREHGGI